MANKLCNIYLVRHGETDWNVKKLIQGHKDSKLTQNGYMQAINAAEKLKNIHFDEVFSSDLSRAHNTAKIITQERNLAIKMNQLLREKSYGNYEGREYGIFRAELKAYTDEFESLSDDKKWAFEYPTIETDEKVVERMLRFIREVSFAYRGKNILVVTHAGIIGLLLIHLGIWTYKDQYVKNIGNASFLRLESDGIDFFVKEADGIEL